MRTNLVVNKLLSESYQGSVVEFTVVQKFNQGNIRHRDVIDGGAFFGYFLGKQKVTKKNHKSTWLFKGFI